MVKLLKRFSAIINGEDRGSFRIKRILLAGITSLGSKGVNLLLMLISIPLTYNYLGEERFAMLMTLMASVAMLNFADLGLGFGLLNRIPGFLVKNEERKIKSAVSSTFFFLLGISLLFGLILVVIHPYISWSSIFNVSEKLAISEASSASLVFLFCFLISLPFTLVVKIQGGFQEQHINNYWEAGGNLFSLLCLLLSVYFKAGVPIILLVLYGSKCLFIILNFLNQFLFRRPKYLPQIKAFDLDLFKVIFREGIMFFVLQFLAMLTVASDNFIITQKLGPESVATFAIGYRLFSILMMPVQAFINPTLPAYNDAFANDDIQWLKKLTKKIIGAILIISLISAILYYTLGNWIIKIWISGDVNLSVGLLIGFSIYIIYSNLNAFFSTIMLSRPFLKKCLMIYPAAAIISFGLKFLLISPFGVSGVLWANIIGFSILFFIPSIYFFNKYLAISFVIKS